MGDLNVRLVSDRSQLNAFTHNLLLDIQALERMLEEGWFNVDPLHIGAEQELCIVDKHFKPESAALRLLENLDPNTFTTELALFNIEANLQPEVFSGNCFSSMHNHLDQIMARLRELGDQDGIDFVQTGILPTIRKFDLDRSNVTPLERYNALLEAIRKMRGTSPELHIFGLDELNITHDSAMLESCNTSFQVHMQVRPADFVSKYNTSQALAGAVLAISANSPLLFGKRLWAETRVALFQQSVDTRTASDHIRDRSGRVMFGNCWLEKSIAEMYKDDIVRFRVMLMTDPEGDVLKLLDKGITPRLRALMIHNSTVYRWNRPCYGISPNGKPHLRIENRVLPAGPSTVDQIANAAFWLGLMSEFDHVYPDLTERMEFDHAKDNFVSAARDGLNTDFTWLDGKKVNVSKLILKELLPIARKGLENKKVNSDDISKYLGIIEARTRSRRTGTQWILDSHTQLMKVTSREEVNVAITACMVANQRTGKPIHEWKLATLDKIKDWKPYNMLVEEFMTTDLFTVHPNDIPELVSDILTWRNLKHLPVEDEKGRLKGMINYRILLEYFTKRAKGNAKKNPVVKDLMISKPITISPDATIQEALLLMKREKTDCLPVVKNERLVGIITEGNFMNITNSLIKNIERS